MQHDTSPHRALAGVGALGGWVATVPELDIKLRLGTHCYHHAWHADLWHKRLPELREMNPERLTQPANDDLVAFVDAMTEPEAPETTIEKLVEFMLSEHLAAYFFRRLGEQTEEPVLAELLARIAADEVRHAQSASDLIAKRIRDLEEENAGLKAAIRQNSSSTAQLLGANPVTKGHRK